MAATEVTQKQWTDLGLKLPPQDVEDENAPVVYLNFFETLQWLNALSRLEGLEECYLLSSCSGSFGVGCADGEPGCGCAPAWSGGCAASPTIYQCNDNVHRHDNYYQCVGYRLSTTAEWEYAAKAGTSSHTYNGDISDNPERDCIEQPVMNDIAWYCSNSGGRLHSVAGRQKNPWGLFDMLGNAAEWTDYYDDGRPLDETVGQMGESLIDPVDALTGTNKSLAGGFYSEIDCYCRPSRTYPANPTSRSRFSSFRPVRTIIGK